MRWWWEVMWHQHTVKVLTLFVWCSPVDSPCQKENFCKMSKLPDWEESHFWWLKLGNECQMWFLMCSAADGGSSLRESLERECDLLSFLTVSVCYDVSCLRDDRHPFSEAPCWLEQRQCFFKVRQLEAFGQTEPRDLRWCHLFMFGCKQKLWAVT